MIRRVEHPVFGPRLALGFLFSLAMFGLLAARLWYLQGVQGTYYRDLSENNRIRTMRTIAARGKMFDRENRTIVGNRPAFNVALILEDISNLEQTLVTLAELSGKSVEDLRKQLGSQRGRFHFEPKVVLPDISREILARIKVNSYRLPGVIITVAPTRDYPNGSLAAQVLGYGREINREQLEERQDSGYRRGDIIGQAGLEKRFEEELRGQSGYRQVEVDARGNRKGELGIVDDLPGNDLYLTLDLDLQRTAETELVGKRGAVVALDPRNGDVLALASTPGFDLALFAGQISGEDWQKVVSDRDHPLNNRAIGQVYPPGSTFKLVTTVAGLAEKKISVDTTFSCPGYYFFAGRRYHCHKRTGHGSVNLTDALKLSCNAYYFQLGQLLGISLIEKYARLLGLGAASGVDLPGEEPGIVPSEAWKIKTRGDRWYPGDTLPVSIGQGYLVVTPMQMALVASTIANGGKLYKPRLVSRIVNPRTTEARDLPSAVKSDAQSLGVTAQVFEKVRTLAEGVVNDPRGTGKAAKYETIKVGGKTGTAQVGRLGKESLGERFKDHAWFVSFAPVESPTIAMAVIVENSGHGGAVAAPLTKKIYDVYFKKSGLLVEEAPSAPATTVAGALASEEGEGLGDDELPNENSETFGD